jgi:hypothetical protein
MDAQTLPDSATIAFAR